MARINVVNKSRKENKCGGCGKIIPVGSKYFYVDFYSGRHAVRCASCGFKRWETTENSYLQTLYQIQDDYQEKLDNMDADTADTSIKDDIVSDLENLRDECQERFDNIPEQLQDGDAGSLLQERIDSLDEAISDIDNVDFEEFDDWKDDNGYDEESFDSWCEENGFADEDDFEENIEDHKSDFEDEAKEKYEEYLEDVRSEISDALSNIAE